MPYHLQYHKVLLLYSHEYVMAFYIDVGAGEHWGHVPPRDFAINKEVPFLFLESAPIFLTKKCPQSVVVLQV